MWEWVGPPIERGYDALMHIPTNGFGFVPMIWSHPAGVGTNGQISSWGAQLAGAAPPQPTEPSAD